MPVERVVDGDAELVLDDRLSPILIATWFGAASPRTIDGFHAWVDLRIAEARSQGRHLVVINDSADAKLPDSEARRRFAEHAFDTDVLIAVPTVIDNPLIRKAVSALGWALGDRMTRGGRPAPGSVARRMNDVTMWRNLPDAFDRARTALREVGEKPPAPARINAYTRPQRERLDNSQSA